MSSTATYIRLPDYERQDDDPEELTPSSESTEGFKRHFTDRRVVIVAGWVLAVALFAWLVVVHIPKATHGDLGGQRLLSDRRGHIALLYSGTARSFSANFESHIVNLMLGCPYTVHLFIVTNSHDTKFLGHAGKGVPDNYDSVNATLTYFKGYRNLDNEEVWFDDAVKANILDPVDEAYLEREYPEYVEYREEEKADGPINGGFQMPAYYRMWHAERRAEELRQEFMTRTGIKHDLVFRIRHDATFFNNWWQTAFTVEPFTGTANQSKLQHDVATDWGVRATRLYDMVYTPRVEKDSHTIYAPNGWGWGGVNDQFAAMGSDEAEQYFTRVQHVREMHDGIGLPGGKGRIHAETSVMWVGGFYGTKLDDSSASICYDITRTYPRDDPTPESPYICGYKWSGVDDCRRECPLDAGRQRALATHFQSLGDPATPEQYASTLSKKYPALGSLSANSSSFYLWNEYKSGYDKKPCQPETWTKDVGDQVEALALPAVIRSRNRDDVERFNKYLTCGKKIALPDF